MQRGLVGSEMCIRDRSTQSTWGTYSIGLNTCTNCPAGNYCPTTTREPLDCPAGTYCPVNSVTYIDCPIGHECTSTSTAPAACSAGKYSLGRQTSCTTCPEGFYCPSVSSSPILCPLGYYTSAAGQTSCTECPAGFYCIGALLSPVSYTHLTLPTILLVQISVVAVSLKKKKNNIQKLDLRHIQLQPQTHMVYTESLWKEVSVFS
eukprot:TRINITY_DN13647_c0_g1_i1.p1 TRINITY_DN13647_c0_g1~~TRINITY_DN13647_c0_g1_i1.p1  ORF type:complete len:205 (+),score=25.14 TRINITY_DN13647_c0_g1_i1:142-756(+)